MATKRTTKAEIEAAGEAWRVYNKTPSRRHAKAVSLATGESIQIGSSQEVLDLTDTDEIESRIIAVLAGRQAV